MTADKMFEELGYWLVNENENNLIIMNQDYEEIQFNKKSKTFSKSYHYSDAYITMQELKAINKKCEELGWLGE